MNKEALESMPDFVGTPDTSVYKRSSESVVKWYAHYYSTIRKALLNGAEKPKKEGEWQDYTISMKLDPSNPDHGTDIQFNGWRYTRVDPVYNYKGVSDEDVARLADFYVGRFYDPTGGWYTPEKVRKNQCKEERKDLRRWMEVLGMNGLKIIKDTKGD